MTGERLLLVGAGHAHLHLLRHTERLVDAGYEVTLVAPRWFDYSGAASGVAAGGRDRSEGRLDVAALAGAGVTHLDTRVVAVDPVARTATTDAGETLAWDVLSLNIGSVASRPGGVEVGEDVVAVKPLSELARLRDLLADPPAGGSDVTVVGAGASGLELAGHLAARRDVARVRLLEVADRIGGSLPPRAAARVARLLRRRGVEVVTGVRLRRVDGSATTLADGTVLRHDVAVLATGLAPPPLAVAGPVGGPDGIPVGATLQHRDFPDVYAAGDCADFLPGALPRVGVHGVRQGPVLLDALEARRRGDEAPVYEPQRRALAVLDLGAGLGLAVRGRWWWLGRSSLVLKRWIDRRWLDRHRG